MPSFPPSASTAASPGRGLKVLLWGDSGMGNSAYQGNSTALGQATQTAGVATWTVPNHGCYKGEPVQVANTEDQYWYGKHTISAVVDANTIQFAIDPRAAADVYPTRASATFPVIILSHQHGKNNPALQSMMLAGVIPDDFVNIGANSQTALSMGWHISRDILDYPDFDLVVCSTVGANDVRNNINGGNLGQSLAQAKARLLAFKTAGKRVLFLGWMPDDARDASKNVPCLMDDGVTPYSPSTNTVSKASIRFNTEMKSWCAANGIDMISQFDALVDSTSPFAYANSGTLANDLNDDGVHVGHRGARRFAKNGGAAWFKAVYPAIKPFLPSSLMDCKHDTTGAAVNPTSTFIFRNPLLATVSGLPGLAADVGTGGSFGMPAAVSYALNARTAATDGDTIGYNQRAVYSTTNTAAGQGGGLVFTIPIADIKLGGKLRSSAHAQFTALTSFQGYRMIVQIVTSNYGTITSSMSLSQGSGADTNNFDDTDSIAEWPFTPWVYIPADAVITAASMTVQGFVKAVAGAGTAGFTMDVGRPCIESR